MADWQRKILLNPEWDQCKEGEITRQQLAASIAAKLRALAPFNPNLDIEEQRQDLAADFEAMSKDKEISVVDFDGQMGALYDWGDERLDGRWNGKKVCWIDSMSAVAVSPLASPPDTAVSP